MATWAWAENQTARPGFLPRGSPGRRKGRGFRNAAAGPQWPRRACRQRPGPPPRPPNAARKFLRFFQEPAAPWRMVISRGLWVSHATPSGVMQPVSSMPIMPISGRKNLGSKASTMLASRG